MDNNVLGVNVESLRRVSYELDNINSNIRENLSYIKNEYENRLDNILNTNASQEYKRKVIEYIDKMDKTISTNDEYLIKKLNDIANIYNNLNDEIRDSVKKEEIE